MLALTSKITIQEIERVQRKAVDFLSAVFEPDKGWSDFCTNRSGSSTSWVTAHVLLHSAQYIPSYIKDRAFYVLLNQRQNDGCWGYSENTPSDCDSTAQVALSFFNEPAYRKYSSQIIPLLSTFKKLDGGLATYATPNIVAAYRNDLDISQYVGWSSSHPCVTAFALRLMISATPSYEQPISSYLAYLESVFNKSGCFPSYWWSSDVYTAHQIAISPYYENQAAKILVNSARSLLLKSLISGDGIILNKNSNMPCPLETARAVLPMLSSLPKRVLHDSLDFFVESQTPEGAWYSTPTLRIPYPSVLDPDLEIYPIQEKRGVGSISSDKKGIYTTAVLVSLFGSLINQGSE